MSKAFVFGKFLPFHKGHEAMIRFALDKCNFLTVLVCCSDKETLPGTIRKTWIEETFEDQENIEVKLYHYTESELPNTSQSSEEVSRVWASVFTDLFPGYHSLVTSEPYGDFVARFMNIRHLPFETTKKLFPVSSTAIQNDLFACWQFLPDSVKRFYAIKVVILGTESTGKTTLSTMLAEHFQGTLVSEAGRDIVSDSNSFDFTDLDLIANEHASRIEKAIVGDSPLIIIDTDIHITKSYTRFVFNKELPVSNAIYEINKAHLYLYLNNDVAYYQDGTRLPEDERNKLDKSHRQVLGEHKIEMTEITGNWQHRFEKAIQSINKMITNKRKLHHRL